MRSGWFLVASFGLQGKPPALIFKICLHLPTRTRSDGLICPSTTWTSRHKKCDFDLCTTCFQGLQYQQLKCDTLENVLALQTPEGCFPGPFALACCYTAGPAVFDRNVQKLGLHSLDPETRRVVRLD